MVAMSAIDCVWISNGARFIIALPGLFGSRYNWVIHQETPSMTTTENQKNVFFGSIA